MTSTRNGAATDPLRHFPTPGWAVDAVLPELSLCGTVVDAGCGSGAVMDRVRRACNPTSRLIGVEVQRDLVFEARMLFGTTPLDPVVQDWPLVSVVEEDFLTWEPGRRVDLVIANPPFSRGDEFYRRGRALTRAHGGTVCLLLRLDWLGSQERRDLLEADPPDALVLERRPQFRRSKSGRRGSDSCEYAWMRWSPGGGGRWKRLRCAPADRRRAKKHPLVATSPMLPEVTP